MRLHHDGPLIAFVVLSMHLQHEPPEVPEESTSEEEEEEKSLATHIAMRPSVVREAVSTKSTRTGKLDAGDFLQVHEEQMGQKGIVRLRITVVPEVMPEEECVVIAYTYPYAYVLITLAVTSKCCVTWVVFVFLLRLH
eukprot:COSAG06_NODE_5556_length_3404_cov_1.955825_2_plen_138_part_00